MKFTLQKASMATRMCIVLLVASQTPSVIAQDPLEISRLSFYGSGDIQKTFESGEGLPANTGLGVNFTHLFDSTKSNFAKKFSKLEFDATINVASTVDTIVVNYKGDEISNSSLFGASILTPLNSGQAVKISLRMDFRKPLLWQTIIDGFKIKYIGSNRNWQTDTLGTVVQATNNYFRAGLFHEFLPKDYLNNYSINIGLYFAYNSLKGDIGLAPYGEKRKEILGTDKRNFIGPEVALEIRLKNLRAEFGYSFLQSGTEVPGLTSGRLLTTISFVGGFPLELKKNNDSDDD